MSAPPAERALLDLALDIARQGGDLTLEWFGRDDLVVQHKGDASPVTEADRAAERLIRSQIERVRPDDAIVGEEEPARPGTSGVSWCIDPLDGTRGFTRGIPLYSTLVAVSDEHGPAVGVVHMPALGETVYAGRGLGCFSNGKPVRVSATARLREAVLSTSSLEDWPDRALAEVRRSGALMRTWGDGYGYALVATGRVDVMFDPRVAVWDVAPMPVIIAEAGGRFSDRQGVCRADGGSGVATNGLLHDELLSLI